MENINMKKKYSILLTFSIFLTSITVYYTIKADNSSKRNLSGKINLCLTTKWVEGSILPNGISFKENKEEISAKIDCLSFFSKKIKKISEVRESIKTIVMSSENNIENSFLCHDFLHELGSISYIKFKKKSLQPGFDSCGWGYYHGAMLMSLKNINKEDLKNALEDCNILSICLSGKNNNNKNTIKLKINELLDFCYKLSNEPNIYLVNESNDSGLFKYSEIGVEGNNEFSKPYYIDYSKFTFCGHGIGHAIGENFDNLDEIAENCSTLYRAKDDPYINSEQFNKNLQLQISNKSYHKINDECFSGAMNAIMERIFFRNEKIVFKNIYNGSFKEINDIINECLSLDNLKDSYLQSCIRYPIAYSRAINLTESIDYCDYLQNTSNNNTLIAGCYEGIGHKGFMYYYKYLSNEQENKIEDIIIRNKKGSVGRLLNLTCGLEFESQCVVRFTLETLQTIRNIDEMKEICNYLYKDHHKISCRKVVDVSLKS